MAGKVAQYRAALAGFGDLAEVEAYLKANSNLPGPRGNLELVEAAGDVSSKQRLWRWSRSDDEFVAVCGAAGLGRFARDDPKVLPRLKELAADPRWRVREGVAMALQRFGAADMARLIREMKAWAKDGDPYVQRAAAAGLCEPALLGHEKQATQVLAVVDSILESLARRRDRKGDAFRVLRQALGYCVSVAAAAAPAPGRSMMERWVGSRDPDVRWVMKSNLAKARTAALGPAWVRSTQAALDR